MPTIYKKNCDHCGKHYEGSGKYYCSYACDHLAKSTPTMREKIRETTRKAMKFVDRKKLAYWKNRKLSKEHKEKIRRTTARLWKNPVFYKRMFDAFSVKPNNPEKFLIVFLKNVFPNEYSYVGDGRFIIGGKCPDFLNTKGQKKLIELFGSYWHGKRRTGKTKKENERKRIEHFKKFGYDTLIIWESELKDLLKVEKKIEKFTSKI